MKLDFTDVTKLRLRDASKPVKALAMGYLLALSLAYVYAIGNIFLAVGWTPKAIAIHYYGSDKRLEESANEMAQKNSGEEALDLETLSPSTAAKPELGPRPSFKNLVATGHFHLFGMSSFFFGLCLLGLFTSINDNLKSALMFFPFVTVILDNLSFIVTRFVGPQFAYLTALAGGLMGICFLLLWVLILREVLLPPIKNGKAAL